MADLPNATVTIDDQAGAFGGGDQFTVVMGCVEQNADITPRVYASTKGVLTQHGYGQAVDYVANHIEATKRPVIFVALPAATAGAVKRQRAQVTGTSVITVTAATGGIMEETDGLVEVTTGGTVGTIGIVLSVSLDGGRTKKSVRLGTATSYTFPLVGIVVNFAAGTLVAGDTYTFETTAPMWDADGVAAARTALASQLKSIRSWVMVGDVAGSTLASAIVSSVNAYETQNDRFVYARVQVRDRIPYAAKTKNASETLTFAEVGATGDTITRSAGSWLDDGFRVGDVITVSGTVSNNVSGAIASLTDTVLTLGTTDLAAESIASNLVTITKGETTPAYVASMDTTFSGIDSQKRVDLGLGRARKLSPITGWSFRRPVQWAASIRENQHDVHIPCWRKQDGPLDGWDLEDELGNVVEFDQRTDGGALEARFTCFRTFGNGPSGAFVALSMTRAAEGSLLSRTHNMAVTNLACTVVHAETENAIGQVLVLRQDGTGSEESLSIIEGRVNTALQVALLQDKGEGPRASSAVWSASRSDLLNIPGAELTGTLNLLLNGTLEKISTRVRVQTAG